MEGTLIPVKSLHGHTDAVQELIFSKNADELKIISTSSDETVRIWDAGTGKQLGGPLLGHGAETIGIAVSTDGTKIIASGSFDHTIRIRNAHTGERLTQPLLHAGAVHSLVWSPDGRQLISACNDGQICFWSAPTGTQLGSPLQAHLDTINSMAISPSGSLLASASNDHTARLWNTVTRQPFGRVLQHNGGVSTVAFSPNGQFVATGGTECIIFLWDISQEGVIATDAVSVSLLHAAPIPHFAGVIDQVRW
ncbi:WD40 repeat-like protein [Paxillus ammoniavirescens]|nr:WD40 repeat-like protein [Paxillus ammoniavirescens]